MNRFVVTCAGLSLLTWIVVAPTAQGCTNLLVSVGASADGSTMITYAADSHEFYGDLPYTPAAVHREGATRDIYEWDTGKYLGAIPQPPRTYAVLGHINEHQVAVGETTYGGREELQEPNGIIDYGSLMFIALERSRTAREAIEVMREVLAEYGYASSGESFSISDPREVWIMDLIGKGPDEKGAVWVARRVPDGYISGHANQARIRTFPLDDPEECLYAEDTIEFARRQGWFDGRDEDFSFTDTYAPLTFGGIRFCDARVWSAFRRAAPSLDLSLDYAMGVDGAEPFPLWIKPERKLEVRDVMELMRDHFEGTPMDMTVGVGAGPYACPYRWRPLTWELDGERYLNERAISTQQTGFSFVTQSRSWLPDPIGGVFWFGLDDTYSTVYVPMYCGIRRVPRCFARGNGSILDFTWDSAFWVFNWVANYAYSRYSEMIVDIRKVQAELEGGFLAAQPDIEAAALELYERSPGLARDYLTDYSCSEAERVTARWRRLGEQLIVKYLDGNLKNELGEVEHPGYSEEWRRRVVDDQGELLKVKRLSTEPEPTE